MNTLTAGIADSRYDAGIGTFNPLPLVWAAEQAAEQIGAEKAKAEVKKINRIRERSGLIPVTFPYGHPLF